MNIYERTIGYYIREYRNKAGMSQVELAKRANYYQPHISAIESDKKIPEDETLEKIAEVLGINFEYLVVLKASLTGHLKEELTKQAIEILDKPLRKDT